MNADGQAQTNDAFQGIPFGVETVNAPAGADASAILALATPTQSTASVTPIDLEFQLPPGIVVAGGGSHGCNSSPGTSLLPWILGAIALLLVVR